MMCSSETVDISIIIPYYNVKIDYFEICFHSIQNQSFKNFEVIVIDDGSEKSYAEYLDKKIAEDKRFLIVHQKNKGVSEARNAGLALVNAETVCFIDADDYIAPWMLEDLWAAFYEYNVDAVCSYYQKVRGNQFNFERNIRINVETRDAEKLKITTLIGMNCTAMPNGFLSAGPVAVLFRTQIAKSIPFPKEIKYMEDVIWNYHYYDRCNKIAIVKECIYAYRQSCESATHAYSIRMIKDRLKALMMLKETVDGNDEWLALRILANYAICCQCCIKDNRFKGFSKKFREIKKLNEFSIWDEFRKIGIAKHWDASMKVKRFLAITGFLPLYYCWKNRREENEEY